MENRKLCYVDHYVQQVGGQAPAFIGSQTQRGHGLGGVLAGLFRSAAPLLKSGAKALGKHGLQVAKDVVKGQSVKQAVKKRAKAAGKDVLRQMLASVRPPGIPAKQPIKRKASTKSVSSSQAKRRRTSPDIFS